jgi:hypothetical protein
MKLRGRNNRPVWLRTAIVSAPTSSATFFIHYSCASYAERTGFPFEGKHWCRRQARRKCANNPTAPSARADPGLVLVRGQDRPSLWDDWKGWIMSVKLTQTQLVMMSAAAQRRNRCLSAPATIKGAALSKVSAKLVKLGLACEIEAKPGASIWRRDDVGQGYALKLTAAGLKALDVDEGSQEAI